MRGALLCCFILFVSSVACSSTSREMSDQEIAAIREAVSMEFDKVNDAVDRLDCSGIKSRPRDREPVFVSQGRVSRTSDAERADCEKMLVGRTGASWTNTRTVVHVLSPNAAYLVREGTYTISYHDRAPRVLALVISNVFERHGGNWLSMHFHESFTEQ